MNTKESTVSICVPVYCIMVFCAKDCEFLLQKTAKSGGYQPKILLKPELKCGSDCDEEPLSHIQSVPVVSQIWAYINMFQYLHPQIHFRCMWNILEKPFNQASRSQWEGGDSMSQWDRRKLK